MRNCVFFDNRNIDPQASRGSELHGQAQGNVSYSYIDSTGTTLANGTRNNIVGTDPKFRDFENGNYHLRGGSPAKESGLVLDWHTGATDLDGLPRFNNDGETIAMGCYRFTPFGGGTTISIR